MLIIVLFPMYSDQHLEATTGTARVSVAAKVMEGISNSFHRPTIKKKHAPHRMVLTGSTSPSIPSGMFVAAIHLSFIYVHKMHLHYHTLVEGLVNPTV